MPFRILTVCTGNICRSPQAEQLLRAGFAAAHTADAAWELPELSSAGTMALVGDPMPEQAAALAREFGADPSAHAARQLTRDVVEQSDLILAMAREHRSAVAKLSARASRYTFTLRELARILAPTVPSVEEPASEASRRLPVVEEPASEASRRLETPAPGDFPAWLAYAASHRGYHPGTLDEDDVVDPYRRSVQTYRRSAQQIAPAVTVIVNATAGVAG